MRFVLKHPFDFIIDDDISGLIENVKFITITDATITFFDKENNKLVARRLSGIRYLSVWKWHYDSDPKLIVELEPTFESFFKNRNLFLDY